VKLPGAPGYQNLLATDAEPSARVAASFGPAATAVNALYPASAYGGSRPLAYSAAITDSLFACGTRQTAKALAASGVPVYAYEFDDPNAPMALQPPASYPFLSYHAAEIQYLFDLLVFPHQWPKPLPVRAQRSPGMRAASAAGGGYVDR
jgi:para-nitrobenzyl esterase